VFKSPSHPPGRVGVNLQINTKDIPHDRRYSTEYEFVAGPDDIPISCNDGRGPASGGGPDPFGGNEGPSHFGGYGNPPPPPSGGTSGGQTQTHSLPSVSNPYYFQSLRVTLQERLDEIINQVNHLTLHKENKWTTIFVLATEGKGKLLRLLLENEKDVNVVDKEGLSPLCWAALADQYVSAVLLLEHGTSSPLM
jgi:hypothetical protein